MGSTGRNIRFGQDVSDFVNLTKQASTQELENFISINNSPITKTLALEELQRRESIVDEYKGVEIRQRPSGNFELFAPTNGTKRIFNTIEQARDYIDNAEVRDSNFRAMGTDTGSFTQSPNRGSGRRRRR